MFIAALFTITRTWKQPKCPLTEERIKNMWHIYTMEYYSAIKRNEIGGFPGGAVVENLPANAGDMGSSPGLGRSHMPWSNWACEPQLLSLRIWSLCSAAREVAVVKRPAHRDEEWPPLDATRESPRTEMKTQHSHK